MVPGRVGGNLGAVQQSQEQIDAIAIKYGYTGDFLTDFGNFLKNSLTFNFGVSTAFHKSVEINSFI